MKILGQYAKEAFLVVFFVLLFFLTSFFGLWLLIWLVGIPLLALVYNKPIKRSFFLSLAVSFIAVSISFTWVINYSLYVYLLSVIVFSSFLVLFALIFSLVSKKLKGFLKIFVAPFVFSVLMLVYSLSPINSYWADWSMFNPLAAPLIWFIGSEGITFIIILFYSSVLFSIVEKNRIAFLAAVLIVVVMGASYLYSHNAQPYGEKIKVALIQGNFPQTWEWRNENAKGIVFDSYKKLSLVASIENPDIIIWPEYAIADDFLDDEDFFEKVADISIQTDAYLVLGTVRFLDGFSDGRRNRNNIAVVFSPEGEMLGEYNSVSPLPFDKEVIKGDSISSFDTKIGNFGVSLCYEETQNDIARKLSKYGSGFLISMANEAVLDNSSGFNLISRYPDLRAAENGKYLLRVTNTGITKIVNPYGKIEKSIEPYRQGILIGEIYSNEKTRFYSAYGNLILYIVLALLGLLFIGNLRK